jgi:hypothetical protein
MTHEVSFIFFKIEFYTSHNTTMCDFVDLGNLNILPIEVVRLITSKLSDWGRYTARLICKNFQKVLGSYKVKLSALFGSRFLIRRKFIAGGYKYPLVLAVERGFKLYSDDMDLAIKHGQLPIVKFFYDRVSRPGNNQMWKIAVEAGHIDIVIWLHSIGIKCNADDVFRAAARHNHLEIMMYLRKIGYQWTINTCAEAALHGNLAILQWARENGCPWDARICAAAAQSGHLAVLQWARANGCPWDVLTYAQAAKGGRLDILQWVQQNGCPCDS